MASERGRGDNGFCHDTDHAPRFPDSRLYRNSWSYCHARLQCELLHPDPHSEGVCLSRLRAPDGILAFDWDPATATLTRAAWRRKFPRWRGLRFRASSFISASELDTFEGKPTGEVASFRLAGGELQPLSARNSAGTGTCHVAVDATGRMLLAADYTGASAASFHIEDGKLSEAVWTEHYTEHGPNPDRQQTAHAHFASFSPDNRFAYINDLGGDCIHIYKADPATAQMTAAGTYRGAPGSGARTLHFHPNGRTAYCMNELVSTVDVLDWHKADGSLTLVDRIELLPADYHGTDARLRHGDHARRAVCLLCQPRRQFSLRIQGRCEDREADADEAVELRRKNAAQFHARSHGAVDAGGESGFEFDQRVCARSGDGRSGR